MAASIHQASPIQPTLFFSPNLSRALASRFFSLSGLISNSNFSNPDAPTSFLDFQDLFSSLVPWSLLVIQPYYACPSPLYPSSSPFPSHKP
ncbi:hypothetical protein VKT23_006404 [Stygiomarasmius scandens]|uniref:Uncharacterized protein n=1 Tax=Marasmiellus scandens TaxID=2682957 RepID=A0ABR1JNL6_9AGAR